MKIYLNPSIQTSNHSPDGVYEEGSNMQDVATRCASRLAARGFAVKNSAWKDLGTACSESNAWGSACFIALHSDATGNGGWVSTHGTKVFYHQSSAGWHNDTCVSFADQLCHKLVSKFSAFGRGYDMGTWADYPWCGWNMYVIAPWNTSAVPAVLVEGLYHDNWSDVYNVLYVAAGRQAYADGVYEGVCDWYGWNYSGSPEYYVEPRGQNASCYSEDGDSNWGNSAGWTGDYDSHMTSGGSRYFPASTASPSGKWMQVRPNLRVPGGTYQVDVGHYSNANVSTDIVTSTSVSNCTALNGDLKNGSTKVFQFQYGGQFVKVGDIQLAAGQTQPTIKFTYSSGNVNDSTHRWNIEGFRFSLIPTASTLTLNASAGGTVSGGGSKTSGNNVTAVATANLGYRFVSWTTGGFNGTVVSTSASYSFVMPGQGYTLYANFVADGVPLTVTSCPAAGGTTTGAGGYNPGQSVTVTATANPGYTFTNWTLGSCGGAFVSVNPSYTFSMPSSATALYANFAANSYTMSAVTCSGGTVTGSGTYSTGQSVTVTATPSSGCRFVNWTSDACGGTAVVSTDSSYTFNMPANDYTLYANFTRCLLFEGFETYNTGGTNADSIDKNDTSGPNQAPNGSGNPWWGPNPPNGRIDTGVKHTGSKSLYGTAGNCKDCYNLAYRLNNGSAFTGGIYLDWWFNDPLGTSTSTNFDNDFAALSYYSGVPSNADYMVPVPNPLTGNVQQLAIGMSNDWSTGYNAAKYQVRVVGDSGGYANGWFNTSVNRTTGWHHARIVVGPRKASNTNDVSFYIDNMVTPVLTRDSITTNGYNIIELNTIMPKSGNVYSSPLHWNNYDDISFGKIPNAPGSTTAVSTTPGSITWNWVDNSTDEDGFSLYDLAGSLKLSAAEGATSATETGLAANTAYVRAVTAVVTISGAKVDSSKVLLPTTYTLAADPVYGASGNGAVTCSAGAAGPWPYDACLQFTAVNGFGASPASASRYLYVWDTSPGEPNWNAAQQWTSGPLVKCGAPGVYYLHLRACNADGAVNPATLTLGPYMLVDPRFRISDVWPKSSGESVYLWDKTVTAAAGDAFWIEEADRSAALKVLYSGALPSVNHKVDVSGTLGSGTPRVLSAASWTDKGATTPIRALGLVCRALGGAAFNANTPSVTGGAGIYNLGLLVRVAGVAGGANTSDPNMKYFFLDDGSGLTDGLGHSGVKVVCGTSAPPASGMVRVTGVIDAENLGGRIVPVIVVRDPLEVNPL